MSVPHALLGLLARRPMHGYELKNAFEAELASIWTLNYGQLYPALDRLEADGLVERERVVQDDRPDKKVYQITPAGVQELERWLSEPASPPKLSREEFTFKLMAARGKPPDQIRALVVGYRQRCFSVLAEWTRGRTGLSPGAEPVAVLLADQAILRLEADIKWLERVEASIATLAQREGNAV